MAASHMQRGAALLRLKLDYSMCIQCLACKQESFSEYPQFLRANFFTHLPTEQVSTLTTISAIAAKEVDRIIPTIYTFREVSSMSDILNAQVLYNSLIAVGAVSRVPVGAVIMLVTDPAAVLPDSNILEEKLKKLPIEEESG